MLFLKLTLLLEFLFFFYLPIAANRNPWCRHEHSCKNLSGYVFSKHTMCIYPEKGPSECHRWRRWLKPEEKALVLKMHNEIRSKVARGEASQLPAANMMRMDWDEEAEEIAQRWADQCQYGAHDNCRLSWRGEDMGQNCARGGGAGYGFMPPDRTSEIVRMVNGWIAEKSLVSEHHVYNYPENGPKIGHYTQMVWATSTRLGCGLMHLDTPNQWNYKLVCNYMESGNVVDWPVYTVGPHTSRCPDGAVKSKDYPGLCEYANKKGRLKKPDLPKPNPAATPQPSTIPSFGKPQFSSSATMSKPSASPADVIGSFGRLFKRNRVKPPAWSRPKHQPPSMSSSDQRLSFSSGIPLGSRGSSNSHFDRFLEEANRERDEFIREFQQMAAPSFSPYSFSLPQFDASTTRPRQVPSSAHTQRVVYESPPDPNHYHRVEFYQSKYP